MVDRRAVTILALNAFVGGRGDRGNLIGVTVPAIFPALEFDFEILPLLLIACPVPAIHVALIADRKILRDYEHTRHKNKHYCSKEDK